MQVRTAMTRFRDDRASRETFRIAKACCAVPAANCLDNAAESPHPSNQSIRKETHMADNPRWTNRPAGSTWGDYGADDERGRLNLLTPEKVLQGIAEVKVGKTFCLSLPLDYPGGAILSRRAVIRRC